MAKTRTVVLGIGCLFVLLGSLIVMLMAVGMRGPTLGRRLIVSVRLDRPVVERAAADPFAELSGGQPMSLRDLRAVLLRAAEDDRVVGVRLRVDTAGGNMATVDEIRWLLGRIRAAGKWTAAYLDTAGEFTPGNMSYLVATGCDEISLHPSGDINLIGLSMRVPFLRGTFDKLGIRAEYPGRGDYKDARFMYTQRDFTPALREMMTWVGDSWTDQMVEGIAAGRGLEPDLVRHLIDGGPYLGDEAKEAGLVDRLEDWQEFAARIRREGDNAQVVGMVTYLDRAVRPTSGPKIAIVTAVGAILRGENTRSFDPMLGGEIMGSETISRALRNARNAAGVKAVVFRVDSPGGSPLASEIIRRELVRTAEKVPVVVSFSNLGASGGYWIACGAQHFVAQPGSLVGSIGVAAGHLNMNPFFSEKLGVTFGRLDFGANANLYGSNEDWSDPQRAVIERIIERTYSEFLQLVADSRDMTVEEVDAVAQGRVFTGRQALAHGLVDSLGGLDVALDEARRLAGIAPGAKVQLLDYPKTVPWWKQMMGRATHNEDAVQALTTTVERMWITGTIRAPGLVWMPPIYVE
jgi:protease-4